MTKLQKVGDRGTAVELEKEECVREIHEAYQRVGTAGRAKEKPRPKPGQMRHILSRILHRRLNRRHTKRFGPVTWDGRLRAPESVSA